MVTATSATSSATVTPTSEPRGVFYRPLGGTLAPDAQKNTHTHTITITITIAITITNVITITITITNVIVAIVIHRRHRHPSQICRHLGSRSGDRSTTETTTSGHSMESSSADTPAIRLEEVSPGTFEHASRRSGQARSRSPAPGLTPLDRERRRCGDHLPHCRGLLLDGNLFLVKGERRGPVTGSEVSQEQLVPLLQQTLRRWSTETIIIPLPPPTGREWTVEGGRLHSRTHPDLLADTAWSSSCVHHPHTAHFYARRIESGGIVFHVAFLR